MGRNKHTNFRLGTDLEVFTLEHKGLTVDDCQVLAKSGMLDNPKTEDQADAASKLYCVAGVPVKDSIWGETKDKKIVEPSTRRFFSATPVLGDKEATKRYMQERDKKYKQDADSGALCGNHFKDVEFARSLGIKTGKLVVDDDDDDDNDKNDNTEPAKKIRKLYRDMEAKDKMITDQGNIIGKRGSTIKELEEKLKIQEGVNDDLRANLELAKKHQESIESLQKREAEMTKIGKQLREKGFDSPEAKQLLNDFVKVAHDDVPKSPV